MDNNNLVTEKPFTKEDVKTYVNLLAEQFNMSTDEVVREYILSPYVDSSDVSKNIYTDIIEKIRNGEPLGKDEEFRGFAEFILDWELEQTQKAYEETQDRKNLFTDDKKEEIVKEFGSDSIEVDAFNNMQDIENSVRSFENEMNAATNSTTHLINQMKTVEELRAELDATAKQIAQEDGLREIYKTSLSYNKDVEFDKIFSNQTEKDARKLAEEYISQHPFKYALSNLTSIPAQWLEARRAVKAAGDDYQTAAEKVASAIALRVEDTYSSQKAATLEVLQGVAEATSKTYKRACEKFTNMVKTAQASVQKAIDDFTWSSMITLNTMTGGLYAEDAFAMDIDIADRIVENEVHADESKTIDDLIDYYNDYHPEMSTDEKIAKAYEVADRNQYIKAHVGKFEEHMLKADIDFFERRGMTLAEGIEQINKESFGEFPTPISCLRSWDKEKSEQCLKALETAKATFTTGFSVIATSTIDFFKDLSDEIDEKKKNFTEAMLMLPDVAKEVKDDIVADVKETADIAKDVIKEEVDNIKDKIVDKTSNQVSKIKDAFKTFASSSVLAVAQTAMNSMDICANVAKEGIDTAKKFERKSESMIKSFEKQESNMQKKLDFAIAEIQSLKGNVKSEIVPFEPSETSKTNIALLRAATPTASVNFALQMEQSKVKREEFVHNIKESLKNVTNDAFTNLKRKAIVALDTAQTYDPFTKEYTLTGIEASHKLMNVVGAKAKLEHTIASKLEDGKNYIIGSRQNIMETATKIVDKINNEESKENEGFDMTDD